MSNKLVNITLRLNDKATKPLRNVQKKFDGFVNQKFGWTKSVSQSFKALSKASGLTKISSSTKDVASSFSKVGKEAMGFGGTILAGTGLAIGGIIALARSTEELSGRLVDNVKRIGFNVEAYQELQFAAKKNGVSNEEFDKGLQKMTRSLGEAKSGQGALFSFLKKTNPELLKQVMGAKSNEKAFDMLIGSLGGLKDAQKQAAYANILFGKSGANFTNLANNGADGIMQLRQEARALGIMTAAQVEEANNFGDTWDALEQIFTSVKNTIGSALIPIIKKLGEQFIGFYKANQAEINKFLKAFTEKLPEALQVLTREFNRVIAILTPLVNIFMWLGDIFGYTNTVLVILAATVGKGLVVALWGAAKAVYGLGAALMTTPIGWLILGFVGLIAVGYQLWKHWDTIMSGIKYVFGTVFEWIGSVFDSVISKFSSLKGLLPTWLGGKTSAEVNVNNNSAMPSRAVQNFNEAQSIKNESEIKVSFDNLPKGARVDSSGSKNVETDIRMGLMATSTI